MEKINKGKIVQAVGPIIDVQFENQHLPELLTALKVNLPDGKTLTIEVAQHIGDDIVRCIAMGPTEGVLRGLDVIDTKIENLRFYFFSNFCWKSSKHVL